jgi:hypothetical protein
MNASQIPCTDLGKDRIIRVRLTYGWVYEWIWKPSDDILVIWTGGDWVGEIEEFRIIRRVVHGRGARNFQIFRIQLVPSSDLS